jgi:hypothetical protein
METKIRGQTVIYKESYILENYTFLSMQMTEIYLKKKKEMSIMNSTIYFENQTDNTK